MPDEYIIPSLLLHRQDHSHVPQYPEPGSPCFSISDFFASSPPEIGVLFEPKQPEPVYDEELFEESNKAPVKVGFVLDTSTRIVTKIRSPFKDIDHEVRIVVTTDTDCPLVLIPSRDISRYFVRASNNSQFVGRLEPGLDKYKVRVGNVSVNCLTLAGLRKLASMRRMKKFKIYQQFIHWMQSECIPAMLRAAA